MTCIVALKHNGLVYMGGDALAMDSNYTISKMAGPKVFWVHNFLVGVAGSMRDLQLMKVAWEPPPISEECNGDLEAHAVIDVMQSIDDLFTKSGAIKTENGIKTMNSEILIADFGTVFHVASDLQISEWAGNYTAIGCGSDFALGAMHILEGRKMHPKKKVIAALEAAAKHSAGVDGPFHVEKV